MSPRVAGFAALATALGLYYAFHESLWSSSTWGAIAFFAFVLIPAVFGLVWFALPLWRSTTLQLAVLAVAFVVVAIVSDVVGASAPADFAKLGAMTFIGWLFLRYFEDASSVDFRQGVVYGLKTLAACARLQLHRAGLFRSRKFVP